MSEAAAQPEKKEPESVPIVINEARVIFETEHCSVCGILYAFSSAFKRQLRKTRRLFYCPNGHQQYYG